MRVCLMVLSLLLAATARAAETPWQNHGDMLQTRLVTTSTDFDENGAMLAWEAKLAPGWKTYWRSPGEAGLPVRLFQGDTELEILYPVPERFELFGLETYGYSHAVILPFRADAEANAREYRASFMVCKDICVPFEASYSLPEAAFSEDFSAHDVRVSAWLKKTPDREGDGGAGLSVTSLKLTGPKGRQRLIVDVTADSRLDKADLFAEVNAMVHFGTPQKKLLADGRSARFVLTAMMGAKKEDLLGQTARLTFTDGRGHAIERLVEITR